MDGTSIYQAVAAIIYSSSLWNRFIFNFTVRNYFNRYISINWYCSLSQVLNSYVSNCFLSQAGIPEAGLALVFAIDRPLDMCRTVVNVTGDASISLIISKSIKRK